MPSIREWFRVLEPKERIAVLLALAAGILSAAGLIYIFYATHTETVPKTGGAYREGIVGQPAYVNPVLAKSATDKALAELLFANLRDLADNIEVENGGRNVRVHLKENLAWSDNQEITADDVLFTVESIEDPDANSPLYPAWRGVVAERVSKLEVNFKLPAPYVFFTDNFEDLRPVPKHLFAGIPPSNWRLSEYNLRPIGSGYYVAANAARGSDGFFSVMSLKSNPHSAKGQPYITDFNIKFFRNRGELLKDFNSGGIDGFFAADAGDLSEIKRPFQAVHFPAPVYYAVFWNQSASNALADKNVRRALRLAAERDTLIKEALGGNGASSTDPLSPAFFPLLEASSSASSTPLETAKAILAKNGWNAGEDGVLLKKDKKTETRLEFTLTVPDTGFLVKTAERLVAEWKELGAAAKLNVMPLDAVIADPIKNRTYEALLFGNTLERSGDLYSFWDSSERFSPGLNLALYKNSRADSLIDSIRREADADKRRGMMDELRRTIASDEPALFLYSPTYDYATGKRVKGIEPREITDGADRFSEVGSWYLETKRVFKK